ncbi:Ubiquitin-like-conjugating enzyme ATG10 [Fusarium oxysporum f. sp. albedinis]|nr:Ubiquitin-like-conjugating enzyme ATG10 [Fusarium oxysporum f. sp. albedinis]
MKRLCSWRELVLGPERNIYQSLDPGSLPFIEPRLKCASRSAPLTTPDRSVQPRQRSTNLWPTDNRGSAINQHIITVPVVTWPCTARNR